MATSEVKLKSGDKHVVKHQFGTVKRNLNAARSAEQDANGRPQHYAEFLTDDGKRVLVNPAEVETVTQLKDDE